jgi:hypothetical protein
MRVTLSTKEDQRGLLIIPCYNEALVLPRLLEEIKEAEDNLHPHRDPLRA